MMPFILAIQLFLTWFVPPIPWGDKHIFVGDLWTFLWVGTAALRLSWAPRRPETRKLRFALLTSALLFCVIWAHGLLRASLIRGLTPYEYTWLWGDQVQPMREAVIALRFVSWIWGAYFVAHAFNPALSDGDRLQRGRETLRRCLVGAVMVSGTLLILCWLLPSCGEFLGKIYGYVPGAVPWTGRAYGVFSSPIEAANALGLAVPLLWAFPGSASGAQGIVTLIAALTGISGIAATKTLTPFVGWLPAFFAYSIRKASRRLRAALLALGVVGATGLFFFLKHTTSPLAHQKYNDFIYRTGPWKVVAAAAYSRADRLLLGLGFNSYFMDNSYIFLVNRGGILLLATAAFVLGPVIARSWRTWSWPQKTAVLYMLTTGVALDTFISRPVVCLWLAAGIAGLSKRPLSSIVSKELK